MLPTRHERDTRGIASRTPVAGRGLLADHRGTGPVAVKRRALVAQARAETMLQLRRGENLIVTLAIPLGILVFFAKVDAVSTDFAHPVDFMVPGGLSPPAMSPAMARLWIATTSI